MGVWLDSPDARPVVSDDTEPEIGIKKKIEPTFWVNMYKTLKPKSFSVLLPERYCFVGGRSCL